MTNTYKHIISKGKIITPYIKRCLYNYFLILVLSFVSPCVFLRILSLLLLCPLGIKNTRIYTMPAQPRLRKIHYWHIEAIFPKVEYSEKSTRVLIWHKDLVCLPPDLLNQNLWGWVWRSAHSHAHATLGTTELRKKGHWSDLSKIRILPHGNIYMK